MSKKRGPAGGAEAKILGTEPMMAKIRTVFGDLDANNIKRARKELDTLGAKYPQFMYVPLLRALCDNREGKPEEAEKNLKKAFGLMERADLKREDPEGESLRTIVHVCKEMGCRERATALYVRMAELFPSNEQFAKAVFLCHAYEQNYAEQQKSVAKLAGFKKTVDNYSLWRVAMLYCRAMDRTTPESDKAMSLKIADMLIRKENLKTEDQAILFVDVCAAQDKFEDIACKLLNPEAEGNICGLFADVAERDFRRAQALFKIGKFAEAVEVYRGLLAEPTNNLNWDHFMGAIDCFVAMEKLDDCLDFCESFKSVAKLEGGSNIIRSPYLGLVETAMRFESCPVEKYIDLLVEYVSLFASKPVCISDIRKYLHHLTMVKGVDRKELFDKLADVLQVTIPIAHTDAEKNEKTTRKCVFYYELKYTIGLLDDISEEECTVLLAEMADLFEFATSADELPLVAFRIAKDQYEKTFKKCFLIDAAAFLERSLVVNANNSQARLTLVEAYKTLACGAKASEHLMNKDIGVKSSLFDCISHLLVDDACKMFCDVSESAGFLLRGICKFHFECEESVRDSLTRAYTNYTLSKLHEFGDFYRSLHHSSLFFYAQTELLFTAILGMDAKAIKADTLPTRFLLPCNDESFAKFDSTIDLKACSSIMLTPVTKSEEYVPPEPAFLAAPIQRLRRCAALAVESTKRFETNPSGPVEHIEQGRAALAAMNYAEDSLEQMCYALFFHTATAAQLAVKAAEFVRDLKKAECDAVVAEMQAQVSAAKALTEKLQVAIAAIADEKDARARLAALTLCTTAGFQWGRYMLVKAGAVVNAQPAKKLSKPNQATYTALKASVTRGMDEMSALNRGISASVVETVHKLNEKLASKEPCKRTAFEKEALLEQRHNVEATMRSDMEKQLAKIESACKV